MADLMKIVREWEAKRQRGMADAAKSPAEKMEDGNLTDGLPWPGYNGGKQFRCDLCGAHFDTSAGAAKHMVYGCDAS